MFSANHKNKLIMGTFQFFFFNFSKILNREFCLCELEFFWTINTANYTKTQIMHTYHV